MELRATMHWINCKLDRLRFRSESQPQQLELALPTSAGKILKLSIERID